MVARRTHQGVRDPPALQDLPGRGQGAVCGPAGGRIRVSVDRGEGVDAVIARQHRGLLGRPRLVANGKYVWIEGFFLRDVHAGPAKIGDKIRIVHRVDMFVGKGPGRHLRKQPGFFQLGTNDSDPRRRLHVPPVAHMVDLVPVVDHEADLLRTAAVHGRLYRLGLDIPKVPQPYRILPERSNDPLDIVRRTIAGVLSLQNRPDHLPGKHPAKSRIPVQPVEDQVRHAGVVFLDRRLVTGTDDGPGPVALVKSETGPVLLEHRLFRALVGIVRQALEEQPATVQGDRLHPDPVVEGAPQPAAGFAGSGGDPVQVAESDLRLVQQHGKPLHLPPGAFGHEKNRPKPLLEGVAQLFADGIDFLGGHP